MSDIQNYLGKFSDISSDEYHAGPGIGSSGLKTAMVSMAHYYHRHVLKTEIESSDALHIGKLCHMAILEGPRFRDRFVVEPIFEGYTKKGEKTTSANCAEVKEKRAAWYKALPAQAIIVRQEEHEMMIGMIEAILQHPIASGLLTGGRPELSGYWEDEETGLLLKCRPDFLRDDGLIIDYKTTKDASPKWWPRDAAKLGYHIQAGYYRMICNKILGTPNNTLFAFIAQEKVAPYAVTVHVPDNAFMERGEQIARYVLTKIAACKKSGYWPGYSDEALSLSLPEWALKDDEEVTVGMS